MTIGQAYVDHLITVEDVDSLHTIGARAGVFLQRGLLDDTILCGEDDIVAVDKVLVLQATSTQTQGHVHRIIGIDVEQILDSTSLRRLVALRDVVAVEPVAAALLCEEEHRLVHGGGIDILREVLLTRMGSL